MNGPVMRRRSRAFTLVELLVVIGIIAALIGILLPVLAGVSARGRDLKCQANLKTIGQMILTYAAENKGSVPYGYYYNRSHPQTWDDAAGDGRLTTMWSIISRMSGKQYRGDDVFVTGSGVNPEAKENTAPFLRCPEAELVGTHICSYVGQFVAFATPYDYRRTNYGYPAPIQDRPARTTDLMPFTILAYDTAVHLPGMSQDIGYVTGGDIDNQRFWTGPHQVRYYSIKDPFGRIPPGIVGQNRPVGMNVGGNIWKNIDPAPTGPEGFNTFPYQGNLRFRHNKDKSVNVLYADGRVESIEAKLRPDKTMVSHPVLRKSFQTKWPSGLGLGPDTNQPY
jgi:prepilin-type N-terminal cleavage/methylation domain-containing protein/prepilin-type processing-associated H-X9-DG protein